MFKYLASTVLVTSGLANELFLEKMDFRSPEVRLADDGPIPLIIYGGIGADRNAREIAQLLRILPVELGFSSSDDIPFFRTDLEPGMQWNSQHACQFTKDLPQNFQDAKEINVIGVSQGGLNARSVLEECGIKPKVRNLVLLGTPNMGIVGPGPYACQIDCNWDNIVAKLVGYNSLIQQVFAPASYYRDTSSQERYEEYKNKSLFLARINNENDQTSDAAIKRKAAMTGLNKFLAVVFDQDGVVLPKESAVFGELQIPAQGETTQKVIPMEETQLYKQDMIGLKTLNEAGKLQIVHINNGHVTFSDDDVKNIMVPVLKS